MFKRKSTPCAQSEIMDENLQYKNYYVKKLGLYSLVLWIGAILGMNRFDLFLNFLSDHGFYFTDALSAGCYISGTILAIISALQLKEYHENPQQTKEQFSKFLVHAIISGCLLALPGWIMIAG